MKDKTIVFQALMMPTIADISYRVEAEHLILNVSGDKSNLDLDLKEVIKELGTSENIKVDGLTELDIDKLNINHYFLDGDLMLGRRRVFNMGPVPIIVLISLLIAVLFIINPSDAPVMYDEQTTPQRSK